MPKPQLPKVIHPYRTPCKPPKEAKRWPLTDPRLCACCRHYLREPGEKFCANCP